MLNGAQIRAAVALVIASTAFSFGQSANKKAPTAPPKTDTWERSKECAGQAEKMMVDRDRRSISAGGHGADFWRNHYSPKYNRCFVSATYLDDPKTMVKGGPGFYTYLIDAFERSNIASTAIGASPELCRTEKDPDGCLAIAKIAWQSACKIEQEDADCEKAKQFIEEHMKN